MVGRRKARSVDGSANQRDNACGRIANLQEGDIFFGEAESRQQIEHAHVRGGAEAGDADTFALELLDGFDIGSRHDSIVQIVLSAGQHYRVAALKAYR